MNDEPKNIIEPTIKQEQILEAWDKLKESIRNESTKLKPYETGGIPRIINNQKVEIEEGGFMNEWRVSDTGACEWIPVGRFVESSNIKPCENKANTNISPE